MSGQQTAAAHGAAPQGDAEAPIRVGISSCLLGQEVRFDGGHKRDPFLNDLLGRFVEWVPVCPEVEVGMGIPRESVRLERHEGDVRMRAPKSGRDWTSEMRGFAARRLAALEPLELCGYVLKKDSPSCGVERVRLYDPAGAAMRSGRGLFAQALLERWPALPVEEEGRLHDPRLRENFVERLFAYRRLRSLFHPRFGLGDLVRFHTAHKLALLAHAPAAYAALGRLVANAKRTPRAELRARYEAAFMEAFAKLATPRKHANVLHHVVGYFKRDLDARSRAELLALVEDYRNGLVPLVVPLTLVRHYVRQQGVAYLQGQTYLEPHPKELMLRNHV